MVIRNQVVYVHVFNVLIGFEVNYLASVETDLAHILKEFSLDLVQFMKFPLNQIPNKL